MQSADVRQPSQDRAGFCFSDLSLQTSNFCGRYLCCEAMVFFTIFATIDSMTLLFAMTGCLVSSFKNLKAIADIEFDLINSSDFVASMKQWNTIEFVFVAINLIAVLPFVGDWWMAPPQIGFAIIKILKAVIKGNAIDEREVYKKEVYTSHRKWHITGMFFYLISWFIYFARAITAIMDIHVHGISPYD